MQSIYSVLLLSTFSLIAMNYDMTILFKEEHDKYSEEKRDIYRDNYCLTRPGYFEGIPPRNISNRYCDLEEYYKSQDYAYIVELKKSAASYINKNDAYPAIRIEEIDTSNMTDN